MTIPESAREKVYRYLGGKADDYLARTDERLKKHAELWRLSDISLMPTNTVNFLFACESVLHGSCVLKMCVPDSEVAAEIKHLLFYNGKGYCKLWEYDLADRVLLLERIFPGDQLRAVKDYRERARLLAMMVKEMPAVYSGAELFPSYLSWMEESYLKLSGMGDLEDMLYYLDKAIDIYSNLKCRHKQACLLHGDLHQENMLLNAEGCYTIIDPKGVVDDPVMETARFLINELPCAEDRIIEMAGIIGSVTGVSVEDVLGSMFIDAALSESWSVGNIYPTIAAFEEAKRNALDNCEFVYRLIKG